MSLSACLFVLSLSLSLSGSWLAEPDAYVFLLYSQVLFPRPRIQQTFPRDSMKEKMPSMLWEMSYTTFSLVRLVPATTTRGQGLSTNFSPKSNNPKLQNGKKQRTWKSETLVLPPNVAKSKRSSKDVGRADQKKF